MAKISLKLILIAKNIIGLSEKNLADFTERLKNEGRLDFTALSNGTIQSLVSAKLISTPSFQKRAVFWLTKEINQAKDTYHLLHFWQKELFLKMPEIFLWDEETEIEKTRILWSVLKNYPVFLVISLASLEEILPSPVSFKQSWLGLAENQRINLTFLAQELVKRNYEKDRYASAPFFFSQKGGLVDIFTPQYEKPVRLDFKGEQIEKISFFDPKTKHISKEKNQVEIIPLFKNSASQPVTSSLENSLLSYLKDSFRPLIIQMEPEQFQALSPNFKKIEKLFQKFQQIIFHLFPTLNNQEILFDFQGAPLFHHNLRKFFHEFKKFYLEKFQIFIATSKKEEIKNLFKKERDSFSDKIIFYEKPPHQLEGFKSVKDKVVLFTDQEIFGYTSTSGIRTTASDKRFFASLKPGDFVTHQDHGIARFRGIVKKQIEGRFKEYFYLEYSQGDKLFVPLYQADKIAKYIGESHPPLHRLGGAYWSEVCQTVKRDTARLAKELLALQAKRLSARVEPYQKETAEEKALANSFDYEVTADQAQTLKEIEKDLCEDKPMDRLICGDVGFGKTEVAIRAAFKAVMNGQQVAILSPTTILTQQHFDTFQERLKTFGVAIELLSRFQSRKRQKKIIEGLKNHQIDIVIGTHRLLSSDIQFKSLGIVIIDEEQRFGVKHKEKLKKLKSNAHLLILTATPIPRTLNFALAGLKDISTISTPPLGRLPIETTIQPVNDKIIEDAIRLELKRHGQVYYLHNRVETIALEAKALKKLVPESQIDIIHGQLPEKELMRVMEDFDQRKTDVLVSTTIIENGLDLPNVNTLIIKDATRFGLAELYQLRGRIGRGNRQAFAYFLYPSQKLTDEAKKRLIALLETKELGKGFELALKDLEIRGAGNLLGQEQHGKIKAIGLSLYLNLLNQAVEELKTGKPLEPLRDVSIDLPVVAEIPLSLEPKEEKRLSIYQKLASGQDFKTLEEEIKKIFGQKNLPLELLNLIALLKIKILTQKSNILSLETIKIKKTEELEKEEKIIIKFSEKLKPEEMEKLLKLNNHWQLGESQIKIQKEQLGKNWLANLIECVKIFSR